MPGSGDSIQALKAGVMEIPDVIVVNKADHPLTDTMVREISGVLSLAPQTGWPSRSSRPRRRAARASTTLVETLDEHRAHVEAEGTRPSAAAATCATRCWGCDDAAPPGT